MHTTELGALHRALAAVAPIDGVSIGDAADKSTWRIDFAEGASTAQMTAAEAVLANWTGLDAWKADYARRVDADAEACRLQFITPGAGMTMTYAEKFAQAQAVDAMGADAANALSIADREAQFPTLAASVGIEGSTLYECAELVLDKFAQFAALSLMIERARLAGKASIKAAATVDDVRAAYEAIVWPTR
jgi:hypothetical protein